MGALLVAEAAITAVWREPVSALMAQRSQDELAAGLEKLERSVASELRELDAGGAATPAGAEASTPRRRRARPRLRNAERAALVAESMNANVVAGSPLGRLTIRSIGLDFIVAQGAGTKSLRKGPGHYSDTPLPGSGGTVAIGGHRTTFLAPFRRLDRVDRGDRIVLSLPYGRFTYTVEGSKIVSPANLNVLRQVRHERLVLTACHPLYSDAQRIVVLARLNRLTAPTRLPF